METKEKVLATMKEAGTPLNAGKIAELSGIDRKEVDKVMNPDCIFRLLLDKDFDKAREISKNHEVFQPMIIALCDHDNISFENELEKRIKEIRKYPYDYLESIDIWSVVFVKLAKREGMEFYHNYIEIPDFLL